MSQLEVCPTAGEAQTNSYEKLPSWCNNAKYSKGKAGNFVPRRDHGTVVVQG